jgi:signal transduction histidine kinase
MNLLDRLSALWERLQPDPTRTSLAWWMIAIHVAIVLLVGGGISWSAIQMLHDLADEQGKARAQLAAAMAREDLRRIGEDTLTAARALAERPTLQRLVAEGRTDAIPPLLRRACDTAGADACALFTNNQLLAQSGPALEWQGIVTSGSEQGSTFLALPVNVRTPVVGAYASLGENSPTRIFAVRLLDERMGAALSQRVGLEVKLIDYRSFTNDPVGAFTPLYAASLADGRSAVQRIKSLQLYAASVPVFASTGEAIALVLARLPAEAIDDSASHLTHKLLLTALILASLAVLAGFVLSEWVAGPVKALTSAAVRLGQGDFSTSIPPGGAAEVGALARTMEDMRRNLVDLTGTLRRREAEAQAVLGGIVEGVYAVDKDRMIRYLNPQAARLLNVAPDEAVGRFCGDVLKPRDEDGRRICDIRCPILQARVDRSAKALEQLQIAPGPRTTVITSSEMVDGLQVQVIRDETELEAVRRARDSVLANISHEFRTPLAAQLASIELLREGLSSAALQPEQQLTLVRSLESGALRLTRLIDNLLESVRIESGQLDIRRQSVELAEVIEDAHALIGSLLDQRQQRLQVDLPADLPLISGDKPRLTQVFVNLLANANKFAPEGSTVHIGAHAGAAPPVGVQTGAQTGVQTGVQTGAQPGSHPGTQAPRVTAWVEDEGPGPDATDSDALFARFRRGSGQEPEPGGLGLGLWIVKSIIERHEGSIELLRTAENRTRFVIQLPAETEL